MTPTSLEPDQVHIHFAFPDAIHDAQLLDAYRGLLSEEERQRYERFRFVRHRHQFLISHALVRATLSRYVVDVEPAAWRFEVNEHGRPEIADPKTSPLTSPLRFNLSHAQGLVACAVTRQQDLGVDVENHRRRVNHQGIAERFFAPQEVQDLLSILDEEQQRQRFFEYWTLKEAFLKARGQGVSFGLARVAFDIQPDRPPGITLEPQMDDDPRTWRFALMRPTSDHVAALALRALDRAASVAVKTFDGIPLRDERPMDDIEVLAEWPG